MSQREIQGVSGWELIAKLMDRLPPEVLQEAQKCESPIEQLFFSSLALVIQTLSPQLRPSLSTQVPIGRYRADIVLVGPQGAPRVVVECDGRKFHTDVKRDAERTQVIEDHGYRVFRVTGSDIHHNPLARAKELLKASALAD